MSILAKVVAAVTPLESVEEREEARWKARAVARSGDWLSQVLEHHVWIESAFAAVEAAPRPAERVAAQSWLALILTGHANAEESVLYPALARADEKRHATTAYAEQATAKMQIGELATLSPMSQEYLDKLRNIRHAVAHHIYEEEVNWFLELKEKLSDGDQAQITQRYQEEFDRYVGDDTPRIRAPRAAAGMRPHGGATAL